MRSIGVGLVVLAVLVTGLVGSQSQARGGKVTAIVAKAERPPEREEDIVKGYGVSAVAAREQALSHAQERVREQLAEKLGTAWRPSKEVLDPDKLTDFKVVRSLGEPVVEPTLKDGTLVASYHVRVTPDYLREVARVARHQQMSDRHLIAVRVLVGLVALLLVVTGYLRLEEVTRGYATTMLRAAAVAVLLAVGLGLWMTA